MAFTIRQAVKEDRLQILQLHKAVASLDRGLARNKTEIDPQFISEIIDSSLQRGLILAVEEKTGSSHSIIALLYCYTPGLAIFRHVFSNLTIMVHPGFQNRGMGRCLFEHALTIIREKRNDILRVELYCRESNKSAINLYQSLGFSLEGRLKQRVLTGETLEDDLIMAWLNPYYEMKKSPD